MKDEISEIRKRMKRHDRDRTTNGSCKPLYIVFAMFCLFLSLLVGKSKQDREHLCYWTKAPGREECTEWKGLCITVRSGIT